MATLLELRRRVRSVRNIRQITRAMKMVAAARLRRTQDRIVNSRPYSDLIWDVMNNLAQRTERGDQPLLDVRREDRITAVIVTSDRGLCGSFNANVIRRATTALNAWRDRDVQLVLVGKNGYNHFRRRDWPIAQYWVDYIKDLDFAKAAAVARYLMEEFVAERTDAVYIVYNEFKSVLRQDVVVEPTLPIRGLYMPRPEGITARVGARAIAEVRAGGPAPAELEGVVGFDEINDLATAWAEGADAFAELEAELPWLEQVEHVDYLFEPDAESILRELLPLDVEVQAYRALLESLSAEHAARMTAMDNATRNADDLIEDLTLTMNKLRQEEITTEILEVVGGAEALE